jgi:hypothetical protein
MKKNTKRIDMQPVLLHVAAPRDIEYTPAELARDIVSFFQPAGLCLDPCAGGNVFYDLLPAGSEWCEIERGRDFYAWTKPVDWIVSNPPFSHYTAWVRHSMAVSKNIVYLMPVYKVFASAKFIEEIFKWGGIRHIRRYGTGSDWGFPFGHAISAIHYQAGYNGPTNWSRYAGAQ